MRFRIENNYLFFGDMEISELSYTENNKFSIYEFGCSYTTDENLFDNFDWSFLEELKIIDFLEDVSFTFFEGENLIYLGKKNGKLFLSVSFPIFPHTWEKDYSYRKFINEFEEFIEDKENFYLETDDVMTHIITTLEMQVDENFISLRNRVKESFFKEYNDFFYINKIENTIFFSKEHLTAGISILQYFGKLLQEKYPNEKVSVSIKQEDLKVTMVIETPDGKKEEIEEYLNRYGMVITNQITPQEFATNPIQLIELKQELREAQNKILFQQELLSLKDDTYKNRIISLEDEVIFLRKEFSDALLTNKENIQILLNSLLTKDKLIKKLTKSIESRNDVETKQLLLELKEKDSKGYISLKQHIDNAIIGGIVNAPSWIQFTVGILSKVG
jgi:hypothetical protein